MTASNSSTSAAPATWGTALSEIAADHISLRGYDLAELIGTVPFASVVHLLYTGDLPNPPTARLIDAVMVGTALARPTTKQDAKLTELLERHLDEAFPKD